MKLKIVTLMLLSLFISYIPAWANLTKNEVSQLYVAIFNRASEKEGNLYWQSLELDMATTADVMLVTDAAKNYFGANLYSNQAFIEHIYLNTLNKTYAEDQYGITYWVRLLDEGLSRGSVVASLVSVIEDYSPYGPFYNPSDITTIVAYNQFSNRTTISNYMADIVDKAPTNWETITKFDPSGLNVTDDDSSVTVAMNIIDNMAPSIFKCGAFVSNGVWKEFDCYNLAAIGKTTGDDPFTPSWRLVGGYWQWGRKGPDPSQWYDTNTPHFAHGPTGPSVFEANAEKIIGWDQTPPPEDAWLDSHKTINDPCPAGFRIPTWSHWLGLRDNNDQSFIGSWSYSVTNYSSALLIGEKLLLPATGERTPTGLAYYRGGSGAYWSSWKVPFPISSAWYFSLSKYSKANVEYSQDHRDGFSLRCIAE
jgi:uncharacterized protein (TIGR02145 family)